MPRLTHTSTGDTCGIIAAATHAAACLTHPLAATLARQYLGERIILSTGELMAIGRDEVRQALHRDAASWASAEQDHELLFSVNVALTDFTVENGATVVVPGSHAWEADREPADAEFVYAEMSAGSALLYSGRGIRSGGFEVIL